MIKVSNLTHKFNENILFEDLSFTLNEGIHALVGKSGTGKTTLLRILVGLQKSTSGDIMLDKPVSVCFQENRLFPWYSAKKNVSIVSNNTVAECILQELGLAEAINKYPSELSGGMKRRVALARALTADSKTILLDEPFSGLDDATAFQTLEIIKKYSKDKTVLISTHNSAIADTLNSIIKI